jgi:formylglycine-generating enzyme required for sulfatase activity
VGQKRPNDLGLFDMHGNVWTWCQESPRVYPSERIEDEEDIIYTDSRAIRGASFADLAPLVRSANRAFDQAAIRNILFGVRVARTAISDRPAVNDRPTPAKAR